MPTVRAVVVHHSGRDLTIDCMRSLRQTDWPQDRLELVLVDNASTDGVAARVATELPSVRVLRSATNLGYGGACNAAIADLDGADYVAFMNNDVTVDPGWLRPLVETLEGNPTVGAASPKILFSRSYVDVFIESPASARGVGDRRPLGVRLSGIRLDDQDAWREKQLVDGFWGREYGKGEERLYQWTKGRAHLRVPARSDGSLPACALRLAADEGKTVLVTSGPNQVEHRVTRTAEWYDVPLGGQAFDVINNVGSVLLPGGYGADRGFLERDAGQFQEPEEVFAWCGAAVVVSREYLESVGSFDDRLFLYYEDFDLAWRARSRGWRHVYVPDSVVRHVHAASVVEGSRLHDHHVERNRLLVLLRNAPAAVAREAAWRHLLTTASYIRRDVLTPLAHGHPSSLETVRRRISAFADYLRLVPFTLRDRRQLQRRNGSDDGAVETFTTD